MNGFTESPRQELAGRHVRVGVLEPGAVDTELGSHNNNKIHAEILDPFNEQRERLVPADIAEGITHMVTRPRHTAIAELRVMPTGQA
ncbi:hypothetical protein [Streptomyces sp. IB2014 016-6]|uniref:SDR family oxidoreductase n=1 Tax=Streptomyces sp. IB2014 016-6 TaxID=2517818 RepID=UPI00240D2C54|nr:hypothetical protein [Streptomyces sp. IB2014 016-6]